MNKDTNVDKKIVSIDFDGVLSNYHGFEGDYIIGVPIKGAKEFIQKIIGHGFTPVVFTTRKNDVVKNWLREYNFPEIEVTNTKLPSVVYIDDRCVKFDGDFEKLVQDLNRFDVYWREKKAKIFDF